jgi:hypothetical protein
VVTWAPEKLALLPLPVSPVFAPEPDLPRFCSASLFAPEPLLWAWLTCPELTRVRDPPWR